MAAGAFSAEGVLMKKYHVLLVLLCVLCGCRKDQPPLIDVCILDGYGGSDCQLKDGTKVHLLPSEMKNYWSTSQGDMANFSSWCYKVNKFTAEAALQAKRQEIGVTEDD